MDINVNVPPHPETKKKRVGTPSRFADGVYGLGFVGALVYYLQHASSFWDGVLGVLKAIVWPALAVYHLLGFLYR